MEQILIAASIIGAIVLALTQVVKQVVKENKWLPVVNLFLGVAIGLTYAYTVVKGDLAIYAWAGFIAGLSAGGFYDLGANAKGLANKEGAHELMDSNRGERD